MPNDVADPSCFRLYGAERSYFTGKVRPALLAKRVHFEEVLPTPAIYHEIRERTGLLFIPVVVTPEDETWQDTSNIIDALEARVAEPRLIPLSPVQRIVSYLFELYADEFLVLPAMHFRWSTAEGEADARGAFAAMSGDVEAANAFADTMGGTLPVLGVTDETIPVIVEHTGELLDTMNEVFADQSFLLGEQPSLADCAVMGPLYAHLYLDLASGARVRERAPRVAHWIERCNHPDPQSFGGFVDDDGLHESVHRLLRLIGSDAVPVLLDGLADFESWADGRDRSEDEPPRATGFHETSLRGVSFERYTNAYALWLVQRTLDAYRALDDVGRRTVDAAVAGTGCENLLAYEPRHRLGKREFKLVFENA